MPIQLAMLGRIRASSALGASTFVKGILTLLFYFPATALAEEPWPGLELELITTGIDLVFDITHANDGSGRLFFVRAEGQIYIFSDGQVEPEPFLDISDRVGCCNERSLTALAFSPNFRVDGKLYVLYSNLEGSSVLSRFLLDTDPSRADPDSELILLTVDQPQTDHNANDIAFGPDGYLYVALGDGGGQGDPCHRSQNGGLLNGKILRLDVSQEPYAIPADNPFVDDPERRDEIWALGLRNPWRMSFDRVDGDLWIGDAGQARWEEINRIPAGSGGLNFGWSLKEGEECFTQKLECEGEPTFEPTFDCKEASLTTATHAYCHASVSNCSTPTSCAVVGGFRYRGHLAPTLRGVYLFSDWCSRNLQGLRQVDSAWETETLLETDLQALTFGEDEAGELYLSTAIGGDIYRLRGLPVGFADDFESGELSAWNAVQP